MSLRHRRPSVLLGTAQHRRARRRQPWSGWPHRRKPRRASVVISEVYGGGGNSGATLTNDFIELYNASDTAVDLTGWTVQYFSATGTRQHVPTPLTGTIAGAPRLPGPGVRRARAARPPLPTPDATGGAFMSGTAGRVDLLNGDDARRPRGLRHDRDHRSRARPGPCAEQHHVGARTSPCGDTDQTRPTSRAGSPDPGERLRSRPPVCAGGNGGGGGNPGTPADDRTRSRARRTSRRWPASACRPTGVVTARTTNGFWFQSTHAGQRPGHQRGPVRLHLSAPTAQVGDDVTVTGTVQEFRPGRRDGHQPDDDRARPAPSVTVNSSSNPLPAPVVIGVDRTPPAQTDRVRQPRQRREPRARRSTPRSTRSTSTSRSRACGWR